MSTNEAAERLRAELRHLVGHLESTYRSPEHLLDDALAHERSAGVTVPRPGSLYVLRLDFRDELAYAEHEVAARLHRYLWGDTPHQIEPDDGSDCQMCYDETAGLLWHTITPTIAREYARLLDAASPGEDE